MAGARDEADLGSTLASVQTVPDLAAVLRWLRRRLARQRNDSPLTYRELAAKTGWARGTIGEYFAGQALPPTDRFDELVRLLGANSVEQGLLATARDRVEENRRNSRAGRGSGSAGGAGPPGAATTGPPWELPGPVSGFVGRAEQLRALDDLLAGASTSRVVISAVSGTAGVGKTALAVHWAHGVAERFPGGCLFADLRGYGPDQPMRPEEVLAGFLRGLGVDRTRLPADLAGLVSAYRSAVAGRRMLVVLDNARSAEQVRPLLPGSPRCFTLVTSRDTLAGLVARDGAQRLDLDLLPAADAHALLRELIGPRIDTEPQPATALAEQCALLPLALRIAAELAVSRPDAPLAELVNELACVRRRLRLLDAGGDAHTAVRAVFSWSYDALAGPVAMAFRLLGLHPGRDADVYAVAALTAVTAEAARHLLDQLVRAHLVRHGPRSRYSMHDLLRGYAADRAAENDGDRAVRAALTRLFDHYLHTAAAAMDLLYPRDAHHRPALPERPAATPVPAFESPASALAWLEAQRAALVASVRHAAEQGWPDYAQLLARTVWRHLDAGGHHTTALQVHGLALRAAQQADDRHAVAACMVALGTAHARLGQYADAIDRYQQAHDESARLSDLAGQARVLNNIGQVHWRLGRYPEALDHCDRALVLYRELGDRVSEGGTLNNVGLVYQQLGRYPEAIEHHRRALRIAGELGDRLGEVHALVNLGLVHERLGEHARAAEHHRQALEIAGELGDRTGVALALVNLGSAQLQLGAHDEAFTSLRRALDVSREIGDRAIEAEALNLIGRTLRRMGRHQESRQHHDAALAIATGVADRLEQARALDGIGHALAAAGQERPARRHWQRALDIYRELGVPEADVLCAQLFGQAGLRAADEVG